MEQILTLVCKLKPTPTQSEKSQYYIHILLKDEVPDLLPSKKVIGVDFNAVTDLYLG